MKTFVLTLFLLIGRFNLFSQEAHPNQLITELTGKKGNVGIAAAYAVDGEVKWSKSSGWRCEDNETPFLTTTLTRIASITKNFTAVAVMQLVEKDLINLDDSIDNYLVELPVDKKQITVRQLLAHTSGIPQYKGDNEIENTVYYITIQDAMEVFIDRPLLFEPGTAYFYTSYGYVVLGRIIEAVTSKTYEDYMKQHIFDVAQMNSTFIEYSNKEYPNSSCLYHNNGRKVKLGKRNDLSNRIPGGGYISSLEDLIKFGNALIQGKLISQKSFSDLLKTQPVAYNGNKYGLGWYLYGPPPNEDLVVGHSGGQTGCTSQLMIIPKSKTVVVVLSNTSGNYPDIAAFASRLIVHSEKQQ